jgi:hypothetical protein
MVGLTSLTSNCLIYVYVEENNIHEEKKIKRRLKSAYLTYKLYDLTCLIWFLDLIFMSFG